MKKISNHQKSEYIFRVILESGPFELKGGKPYREISILSSKTLTTLARVIVHSFGFYFDHCYGFYDNLNDTFKSQEIFELFSDLPDVEHTLGAFGVTYVKIPKAFNQIGKKMRFLFDYGDGWQFTVELLDIKPAHPSRKNPKIVKKVGVDPEQYPNWDEDIKTEELTEEDLFEEIRKNKKVAFS